MRLGVDQPGVGSGEGFLAEVVLLHPGKSTARQGRDIRTNQRLQADIAGPGHQDGTDTHGQVLHARVPFAEVREFIGKSGLGLNFQQPFR